MEQKYTAFHFHTKETTRSSAIAEGPRDASCQLKSCQLPRNSAETICTTSHEQIEVEVCHGVSSGGFGTSPRHVTVRPGDRTTLAPAVAHDGDLVVGRRSLAPV